MTRLFLAFTIAALAACTAAPLLTAPPVTVTPGELNRYWIPAARNRGIEIPLDAREAGIPGRVVIAYMIDSDGRVIRPNVVESEPVGVYEEAALDLIRTQRFQPAPSNPNRVPVRTQTEITFHMDGLKSVQ